MKKVLFAILIMLALSGVTGYIYYFVLVPDKYEEIDLPTPNISKGRNSVEGVVLHHTATFTADNALRWLTTPKSKVSCHVLIDYDGTRYVLARPELITHHAGRSALRGQTMCNRFTIGIEFQGCTNIMPLTNRQIASAVEYLTPIIHKYRIPLENIVTHEMVRDEWRISHRGDGTPAKPDIVERDYKRVLESLQKKQ